MLNKINAYNVFITFNIMNRVLFLLRIMSSRNKKKKKKSHGPRRKLRLTFYIRGGVFPSSPPRSDKK